MNATLLASLALGAALLAHAPDALAQHTGHPQPQPPPGPPTDTLEQPSPRKGSAAGPHALERDSAGHSGHRGQLAPDTGTRAEPRDAANAHRGGRDPAAVASSHPAHPMFMKPLGSGWSLAAMAQVFPIATLGEPFDGASPLRDEAFYLTQPAAMVNLESPGSRLVLRTTVNLEAETQPAGEYTFGGWGEGFLDKRHPHTFLHEAMLSLNLWDVPGGALSLSAGKGFAPYGTEDPMSRPAVKFPTNHHLSQVLERWTLNGVYLHRLGWSVEAGLFGGSEPTSPSDLSNIESFGDSWSTRVTQRFGRSKGPAAAWEVSGSYARVEEAHHGKKSVTHLWNTALRHEQRYGFGTAYALVEASRSEPEGAERGYYAWLAEARLGLGRTSRHQPYYRLEYSTRPEYERVGGPGTDGFFRYDHGSHSAGASRWLTNTVGYGTDATSLPLSLRPFVELQHSRVWGERGDVSPKALFGSHTLWSVSTGFRVFLGGGAMRMGSYGVLDPMSAAMRPEQPSDHEAHQGH